MWWGGLLHQTMKPGQLTKHTKTGTTQLERHGHGCFDESRQDSLVGNEKERRV
jgi:hypothetical protein